MTEPPPRQGLKPETPGYTTLPPPGAGGPPLPAQAAGPVKDAIDQVGIFDFDGALFQDLWGAGTKQEQKRFYAYVQYYVSDHRPLWMSLKL